MEISESWLREWSDPAVDSETLIGQLTMAGLEVEGWRNAAPALAGVVVVEVVSVEKHPNADKLNLCQVSDGTDQFAVVCGASNVRAGLKVAFARIGAELPGIKIKKAKLRGVESQGMICSAVELQLAEASDGIMELPQDAPPGESIVDYLALQDRIIEIDLTPNRGDCLSIAGVAREVAAINKIPLLSREVAEVADSTARGFSVELEAPQHCPRYVGRLISGIDPQARTPLWMQEKLRRCGLRPISPVVDVTNYVMMELGQPMHGFDFDKLEGGIKVRMAEPGEKLALLDQSEVECDADTLLIADHSGAIALAGIMGGLDSSVQSETRNIFLEAAHFNAIRLAGKARKFGMHTDASHRFERGVDAQLPPIAMQRATELLIAIAGGEAGPLIDAQEPGQMPQQSPVDLRYERVQRLLGIEVERAEVADILQRLNMQLDEIADGWRVTPPSYRYDINIEADLIEEIGRLIGYNNIPGTREASHIRMDSFSKQRVGVNRIRDVLVDRDYFEAVTYSFVSPELQAVLDPSQPTLPLSNPISTDMSVMRTRLLPGLIQALRHNLNRQQSRVRLFETGLCFIPSNEGLVQRPHIAGVISGGRFEEGLYSKVAGPVDFFDIKGDLEAILELANGTAVRFEPSVNPVLHPGQGADVSLNGENIGFVGGLHPGVLEDLDISQPVFVFEIELSSIRDSKLPSFREMSRFPSIRRDISIEVDMDLPVQRLIDNIFSIKNEILQEVFVFDVYTGKEVRNSRKSVALGLILQDFSRTLVDENVENLVTKILLQLEEYCNAVLRES
ncbi:MAG: phenylalanine--tRNA ligase subunit beta [Gammaproteobacteria bacterium]|nr:phenylalanine--tRNA ligase subunit beta [Gammaproteobacteria bacterium]